MNARFELVKDESNRIRFRLLNPDGELLLRGLPCDGKIRAQTEVVHARRSIASGDHLVAREDPRGRHYLVLENQDGSVIARSRAVITQGALPKLVAMIQRSGQSATIIDLTRPPRPRTAG